MVNSNQKPDNNMVWAILSTLFCCLPLGIVSIIEASKVDGLYREGDYEGAQNAADKAKKYAIIGAGIAVAGIVIYFILVLASVAIAA